jgi:hypothetical protein
MFRPLEPGVRDRRLGSYRNRRLASRRSTNSWVCEDSHRVLEAGVCESVGASSPAAGVRVEGSGGGIGEGPGMSRGSVTG